MKIYISGYSDDIVDIESDNAEMVDEFGAYEKPGWIKIFRGDNEGLMVFAQYAPEGTPDGTWVIGVTLLCEDNPLPNWPITYKTGENGYSPVLVVDAPDDVILQYENDEGR